MTPRPNFHGLHLPCAFVRAFDGDIIEVRTLSGLTWTIRLIGVGVDRFGPCSDSMKAAKFIESVLEESGELSVWIPDPKHTENLLKNLTFDRIPGHIFIGSESNLADMIVNAGHGKYT